MGTYKNKSLSKTERIQRIKEASERELKIQEAFKKRKKVRKIPFQDFINELYKNDSSSLAENVPVAYLYVNYFKTLKGRKNIVIRKRFRDLILYFYKKKCYPLLQDSSGLLVIHNMAVWFKHEYGDYKSWKRKSHNLDRQLMSIVKHCFEHYEVPDFLYSVWSKGNHIHINWFIELTNGKGVRELDLPIRLTKKGAHYFRTAPDNYDVYMALRWAQSLSYGADKVLADFLANSFLGRNDFEYEYFWDKVIQFIAKQAMLDFQKLGELLDYLNQEITANENYSIKGRTIASLIRASDAWHIEINRVSGRYKDLIWNASFILPVTIVEGKEEKQVTYMLYELRSTGELRAEGKKMNHCVASYASSCYQGRTAIFTLRKQELFNLEQTLATIEVNKTQKMIVQAKARFNKPISNKAKEIMQKWAAKEGLTISKWL